MWVVLHFGFSQLFVMDVFGAVHAFDRDSTLLNDPCVISVHAHVVIVMTDNICSHLELY